MKALFMGTSGFAVPSLLALRESHEVVGVVTQPDRPSGRGRHVSDSPVKQEAVRLGLPVYQPERVRAEEFIDQVRTLLPLDAIVVAAFGQIIPKSILDMPRLGCVNVHASLLPRHRGAAPVQHALIHGDARTGVTTMQMDPGLDTGPILLQVATDISSQETAGELEGRLSEMGAGLLLKTLSGLDNGSVTPVPQDDSQATLAPSLRREDAEIDWSLPSDELVNRIRAFTPRPGAYTLLDGCAVKVWRASATKESTEAPPGSVLRVSDKGVLVAAREGAALLIEVQPENRKRVSAADFARGSRLKPGKRFGVADVQGRPSER